MQIKLRTVAGRKIVAELPEEATVGDVVAQVCSEQGYAPKGARLVVRGQGLDVTASFAETVVEGQTPTLIAVKQSYANNTAPQVVKAPAREQTDPGVDTSLPEYDGPLDIAHRQGLLQLQAALSRIAEAEVLDLLYIHPTVLHLRTLVQQDASLLAPALQQVKRLTPKLIDFASAKNEQFLALLNEPLATRRGSNSSEEDGYTQMAYPQIGPDDIEALNRIQALGPFPRELVLQSYVDAGRNEHVAAQYLMDLAAYEGGMAAEEDDVADELELLQARVTEAQEAGDAAELLTALFALATARLRSGAGDCDTLLLRVIEGALLHHPTDPTSATRHHRNACQVLSAFYEGRSDLLLQECQSLLHLVALGYNPEALLGSGGLSENRLAEVAKNEGVDLVCVSLVDDDLCVSQVRSGERGEGEAVVVVRRRERLSAADVSFVSRAPEELAEALTATSPQQTWRILHRLYTTIFGETGCADWLPTKLCFVSTLPLPFHALSPHGGVPLSRGRQVTQALSILWLQAAQSLAQSPAPNLPGRKRLLRSTYHGNVPGYVVSKKVAPSRLAEGEWVAIVHFGVNTSGGETVTGLKSPADTAVYGHGVSVVPATAAMDPETGRVWACSSVVSILPESPAPVAPLARPARDTQLVLQSLHAALSRGEHKVEAFSTSLSVGPEAHIRAWVPWVLLGTRLLLGGRRAYVMSDKLKATDDYKYLEVC